VVDMVRQEACTAHQIGSLKNYNDALPSLVSPTVGRLTALSAQLPPIPLTTHFPRSLILHGIRSCQVNMYVQHVHVASGFLTPTMQNRLWILQEGSIVREGFEEQCQVRSGILRSDQG